MCRNDAKTVNVIAEACFSPITKIAVTAIQFFLGSNEDQDDDSDDEEDVGYIPCTKPGYSHPHTDLFTRS